MKSYADIKRDFGGRLIGTSYMQRMGCEAVSKLPPAIEKRITKTCWFLSSPSDAWAFTFRGSDVKDAHFIFLSDELLREDESQIEYTILHEIGHVVLDHKNSIGYVQSKFEIKKQEKEAENFAKKLLV